MRCGWTEGSGGLHRGVVYTTEAGYRKGPEIYDACKGLIVGVEFECAAAAVVSASIGLEIDEGRTPGAAAASASKRPISFLFGGVPQPTTESATNATTANKR